MSLVSDHFLLLALLATLMAAFASLLWKEHPADGRRFFLKALLGLVGCAIALGFLFQMVTR